MTRTALIVLCVAIGAPSVALARGGHGGGHGHGHGNTGGHGGGRHAISQTWFGMRIMPPDWKPVITQTGGQDRNIGTGGVVIEKPLVKP